MTLILDSETWFRTISESKAFANYFNASVLSDYSQSRLSSKDNE
jgi:hypothetical protein